MDLVNQMYAPFYYVTFPLVLGSWERWFWIQQKTIDADRAVAQLVPVPACRSSSCFPGGSGVNPWGYPHGWMVYLGKSLPKWWYMVYRMEHPFIHGWFGGTLHCRKPPTVSSPMKKRQDGNSTAALCCAAAGSSVLRLENWFQNYKEICSNIHIFGIGHDYHDYHLKCWVISSNTFKFFGRTISGHTRWIKVLIPCWNCLINVDARVVRTKPTFQNTPQENCESLIMKKHIHFRNWFPEKNMPILHKNPYFHFSLRFPGLFLDWFKGTIYRKNHSW